MVVAAPASQNGFTPKAFFTDSAMWNNVFEYDNWRRVCGCNDCLIGLDRTKWLFESIWSFCRLDSVGLDLSVLTVLSGFCVSKPLCAIPSFEPRDD